MKRTMSDLRAVIPALTEWTVEPGDKIRAFSPKGDPRDPLTDLSEAYWVPDPFTLQPSYLTDFIHIEALTDRDIHVLEKDLGAYISEEMLAEIHRAIDRFVCTIALERRLASWKQIENQLRLILRTCETLVANAHLLASLTNPNVLDESVSRGALSADQLVKKVLMDRDDKDSSIVDINIDSFVKSCKSSLEIIKPRIKRGRKPDLTFRLFLNRIVSAMRDEGHAIKLPSNENVFDRNHPTFVFLNSLLDICIEKGRTAIIASDLDDAEKSEAVRALSHYRKSQRAIVHYFRDGPLV